MDGNRTLIAAIAGAALGVVVGTFLGLVLRHEYKLKEAFERIEQLEKRQPNQ